MVTFRYKDLPITFRSCDVRKKGNLEVREFLAIRDDGTPVDRFSVFSHAESKHYTAWTGDTIYKETKTMRDEWTEHLNKRV